MYLNCRPNATPLQVFLIFFFDLEFYPIPHSQFPIPNSPFPASSDTY
ncbi:MAG: hypothetical protein F6K41_26680 [Symploca sp. SIO3E6]|nr:hypothetical protein [Caldora sp. SIO3E6]